MHVGGKNKSWSEIQQMKAIWVKQFINSSSKKTLYSIANTRRTTLKVYVKVYNHWFAIKQLEINFYV